MFARSPSRVRPSGPRPMPCVRSPLSGAPSGRTLLLAAALALPGLAAAQVPAGEYAARRAALLAGVDSGVVLAYGAVEPVTHWPPFSQLPSFQYLTGHAEPNAALVLVKRAAGTTATLFVPPRNARQELYVGARVGPAEAAARTGLAGRPIAELRPTLDSLLAGGLPLHVVSDVQTADFAAADTLTRGAALVAALRRDRPGLRVQSLDGAVLRLRARKSAAELALLRRATEISARAHAEAMRAAAPGCSEGEIQAVLEGTFRRLGAERPGYGSIVGSGPNALKLHWDVNDRTMQAGDLLLIDAAAALAHYSSDVTRTMPVSGRFTAEQRAVYDLVLAAQGAFVRQIRAGAPVAAASDSGRAVVAAGLARLGLIESPEARYDAAAPCRDGVCAQVGLFAWHGYGGHGIGLEVHDPAGYYFGERRFEPGDVFTVEPGIYVNPTVLDGLPDTPRNRAMRARLRPVMARYANVGVRIEDVYAVTERGVEWLSSGVPREADAVEALMRERPAPLPGGGSCGETSS